MTALTAFRTLFVAKDQSTPSQASSWYNKAKRFLEGHISFTLTNPKKIVSEEPGETARGNDAHKLLQLWGLHTKPIVAYFDWLHVPI
jgi:hypothetical protein